MRRVLLFSAVCVASVVGYSGAADAQSCQGGLTSLQATSGQLRDAAVRNYVENNQRSFAQDQQEFAHGTWPC